MSRCPDQVASLKRDPQCLSPQASLVLLYQPTEEMKGSPVAEWLVHRASILQYRGSNPGVGKSLNLEMESEINRQMRDGIRKWEIVNPVVLIKIMERSY
ncbi:hypothetical protein TNCV_4807671 [Trichonephila clavipes]|nr:hypothetical protein TNCV_4807671 [Trichonephila clavipes]